MLLPRLYLQLGITLDYLTGNHVPSLSSVLREALNDPTNPKDTAERLRPLISDNDLHLFPQFGVNKHWPPTFLIHGTDDTAVPADESRNMRNLLQQSGVSVTLVELKGEHSVDYVENAETLFRTTFDAAWGFLRTELGNAGSSDVL
jgi:acetyl esterase/lipase